MDNLNLTPQERAQILLEEFLTRYPPNSTRRRHRILMNVFGRIHRHQFRTVPAVEFEFTSYMLLLCLLENGYNLNA
uniref:Uncharacterized protein n=1 Tax=Panagrolaimus sp. PS1159 TaxID=55785 RepID=A0AC35ESB1_9BILA